MKDVRPVVPAAANSIFGLDTVATPNQCKGALAVGCTLVVAALLAASFGRAAGPEIKPFIPMTATVVTLADLLTAFLLLAQFYVNGRVSTGIIALGYAFTGLMSLAFLAAFPGLFRTGPLTLGDEQLSSYVWWIWHFTFPLVVTFSALRDGKLGRISSRRTIELYTWIGVALPLFAACLICGFVFAYRNELPLAIVHGAFQPVYRTVFLPLVVVLNALASAILLGRRQTITPLALWLAVATFAASLDSLMVTLSSARYSYAWDTGKIMTVFAASVVLLMILCEVVGLYGRLARIAGIDALTSLANRRAYEERFEVLFGHAQRTGGSLALLIVDVDFFKRYNDSFGHVVGDECLRWVARALVACATRPLDVVARYGGEEFAIVLPDTPLHGALVIAERIRFVVERLEIVHGSQPLGKVTVSIGVGYTPNARDAEPTALFDASDRALYEAKAQGRNRVVLGATAPNESSPRVAPAPRERSPRVATAKAANKAYDADHILAKPLTRASPADDYIS
jgi:diguanylate cyclase (GGDEF)-like protein